MLAFLLPQPHGIYYFGHRPQWMVAIDSAGLTIGTQEHPVLLGSMPVTIAMLLIVGLPLWLMQRLFSQSRRRRGGNSACSLRY
jgi:hypothetical protein